MESLINAFVTLFVVTDPVGVAAIFAALTRGMAPVQRRRMALRGVSLATVILIVFFLSGERLLLVLGISLNAFRIAGGILFFMLSIDMVFARQSGLRSTTHEEQEEAAHKADISVFPLAFPLIAGPGAMTTVILMSAPPADLETDLAMFAVVVVVMAFTALALLGAGHITRLLGETGGNVINRLLGLVLAALAVQYVLDGLNGALFQTGAVEIRTPMS